MTLKNNILNTMGKHGKLKQITDVAQISKKKFIYAVTNGDEVLQVGKTKATSKSRLHKLYRGALAAKDNKAFICGIYPVISGLQNEYYLVELTSEDDLDQIEIEIHADHGIHTNRAAACWFNELGISSIAEVHLYLWSKFKKTIIYKNLDSAEALMGFELYELVTFGKTKVKRTSGKIVSSTQGDNLEGNILKCINKRYLCNIWTRMCQHYFRYGSHKLSLCEFEAIKEEYSYIEHGEKFEVHGESR
jgi:hypothetical protein